MKSLLGTIVWIGLSATALAQSPNGTDAAQPLSGSSGPTPNAMFAALDTDGDGEISVRELRKAAIALKTLDVDKDGKITLAEAMAMPSGAGGNATAMTGQQNQTGGVVGRGGLGNGATGFGGAGGDPRPTGPNLMQYDRNHDGQLSADELPPQMMGLLRSADQNHDGKLSAQEIQAISQRMNERLRGDRPLPPGISVGPQGVTRTPQKP